MKKNILSLAVASGVAGLAVSAQAAMYLNPEGTGQVLLYPYYNAENGNETSMHIVNTTGTAKAVKVRFMEYVNSQEVLDFNLYLSKYDHFAFTIFANPNGDGAAIITRDNSCTVPALGDASVPAPYSGSTTTNADGSITRIQPFLPYQYAADAYNSDYRTNVGHVEVIEMGVVSDVAAVLDADNNNAVVTPAFPAASYATHDAAGVPANCAGLVDAWTSGSATGGQWLSGTGSPAAGITQPTGGLYGLSNILNNSDAAAYGVEAAAVADFWATGTAGTAHTDPGNLLPSLASGDDDSLVANAGKFYTLGFAAGREIDAVSSLFMAEDIANDVMTNADLSGETDWIVTFPTRRYYVNGTNAIAPFTDIYQGVTVKDASGNITLQGAPNSSCEAVTVSPYNREESTSVTPPGQPIFSPAPAPGTPTALPSLCYETNTIAVNGVSAVNATVSTDTVLAAAISLANANGEGWQVIGFNGTSNAHNMGVATSNGTGGAAGTLGGLPVMGFAAFEYTNATSNFGFAAEHKTSVGGSAIEG
jgi:hypothetical protein